MEEKGVVQKEPASHIGCDRQLAAQLAARIDPTTFGTVKQYFRRPESEILQVFLVASDFRPEEVAAVLAAGKTGEIENLFRIGAVRVGVERVRPADRNRRFKFAIEDIADTLGCCVIYLPPAYVVQLAR